MLALTYRRGPGKSRPLPCPPPLLETCLPPPGFPGRGLCLCVCLASLHLTTLLQQHPSPPCFFSVAGLGLVWERPGPAHSSPVSEAPGLQACSLQCLCCVFFPPLGGRGARVGLGDFCLKAAPSLPCAELIACADGAAGRSRLLGGQRWGGLPIPIQRARPPQCAIVISV